MNIIFDILNELHKYGLTQESYEELLKDCSNKVQKIVDLDWSEICSKYNLNFNPDTIRKGTQPPLIGSAFVSEYFKWKESHNSNDENKDDEYFNTLRLEKQEIQKEKRKLYDERLDLNRRLREDARLETTVDKLENMLNQIADKRYIHYSPIVTNSENDMIVMLSDLHIGAKYYGFTGCYDSDIAQTRLKDYLAEIIEIQKMHNAKKCVIACCGDLISGSIHKSISVTNKENVVEQVKLACEYISDFTYELGKYFETVEFHNTSGNHSRIEKKDDALLDERLDALIPWFLKSMLKNCENIYIADENDELDSTISTFTLRDKNFFAIHGDNDAITDASIGKLALWVGYKPFCILTGHKHYPAMTDVSGIKVIQSGSLGGSGDDYTRQKRLRGTPSQTVLVINDKGIKAVYPIEFE